MLEKLSLLFGLDEKASEKYLEALKKAAKKQEWEAKMQVSESLDFPAVYAYLLEKSDNSSYGFSSGLSAYPTNIYSTEVFLIDGRRLGSIKYSIPQANIMTYNKGNRYIVELDASGKVRLEIIMHPGSSGETIPEQEYQTVFREIFEESGLPPEAVDSFEFFASSSRVW